MSKLEYLNSFLTERLMTVAGEIFEVFKDAVSEYQGELERIRHENRRLRNTLAEIDMNGVHSAQQTPGPKTNSADEIKKHSSNEGPLDTEPSLIQVKLELATLNKQYEQQHPQNHPYSDSDFVHAPEVSFSHVEENEEEDTDLHPDSGIAAAVAASVKVEPCGSQAMFSDDPRPADNEGSDPFSCSYCDETFEEMSELAAHLQGHMALFSCEVCGKAFKKKASLKTHMIVHQTEKPCRCKLCGKSYSCAKVLNVHLISHTGERPFGCNYCEKRFKLKSHLKEHERIHTGEKPFSCPVCKKTFTRSNPVKIHLRNHHRELYG